MSGEVVIKANALVRSIVRGPAHIAAGAVVDSAVGPYTAIGRHVKSAARWNINTLLDEAEICSLPYRLDASVIGQGVVVHGNTNGPRRHTVSCSSVIGVG